MDNSHERFGPFIVIRAIGRGGMGEVFIVRTPWNDSPLAAVKRLRPDVARIPTFSERFKHEADLAVRLKHDNIVRTLDVGSVGTQLYVASELVLGKDTGHIADRLRERQQGAPLAVVIRLLLDVLGGLAYVHEARGTDGEWLDLVHRDVTPGNVLVSYDGVARLADFGLAKSALVEGRHMTSHGEILGTPHDLAPEVIRGEAATPGSDIYGLGAVTYRILTGVAPHQGTAAEVLQKSLSETPRSLADFRPDLPPWVVRFVHRMLHKDPEARPDDARVLARQLEQDARKSSLLLPHGSVGRWLQALFEEEWDREVAEYERIRSIDPDSMDSMPSGTVVLARAYDPGVLELGTRRGRVEEPEGVTRGDDAPDEPRGSEAPDDFDEPETVEPYGAEPRDDAPGGPRREAPRRGATEISDPGRGDSLEADTLAAGSEPGSSLPGFVDSRNFGEDIDTPSKLEEHRARQAQGATKYGELRLNVHDTTDASSHPSLDPSKGPPLKPPPRAPPQEADDARVGFGDASIDEGPEEDAGSSEDLPRPFARPREAGYGRPSDPSSSTERRRGPTGPRASSPRDSRQSAPARRSSLSLAPLLIWIVVAVVVGVAIGFAVSQRQQRRRAPASAGTESLSARYQRARTKMRAMKSAGQPISARAQQLAMSAADALLQQDLRKARNDITQLEAELAR